MYHCHIQFYLIGGGDGPLSSIKKIPPLEHFTHTFWEDGGPEAERIAQADVLFADLRGVDAAKMLRTLITYKKKEADLILLADMEQARALPEDLSEVEDVWIMPVSERGFGFRFQKWQRDYARKIDLWEAKQFVDVCMDSSPNLIWFKDKEGVHEIVNDSFCKVVNKTKEQVQGRRHAYIWDVDQDDPACIESEAEVMHRKETCVAQECIQTGEGSRQMTTYKSPLYDCDGSVMGTVGIAVDVTEMQEYEREILEKNRTLEMLFSTMDCGVMCHSIDGSQILRVNKAALQLLGYRSEEEMMADGFDLIARTVAEEDKERLRESIRSLKKEGDSVSVQYRVRHKSGKELYILGNVKLIEEDGELYYQRFLLDYTAQKLKDEQKWAEKDQEIQYQEQMFEIFFNVLSENIDDVYVMLDATGTKSEFVSPNVERVLGIPWKDVMEDISKLRCCSCVSPAGTSPGMDELAALEPGMMLEPSETERTHWKTGERKWFRESVYCVSIQKTKKIIIYISDRTEEKQVQNTLSDALDMAQMANKAKSAFLGSVSHDIRTPMNAIMGLLPLLREEAHDPRQVLEYTEKISVASRHLLGLINDVLDMNKIESGGAVLKLSELDLAKVIDEINMIIRPQAEAKKQKFQISSRALPNEYLLGDRLRINQILINILSNAVKYTQEGGEIHMIVDEVQQVDKDYSRIRFTVSDNGQGMSEEYQKVIFEPFSREEDGGAEQAQGTGLGMAITKSLVNLMHGSIKLQSKLGEGSTFVVELELRNQDREDNPHFWDDHGVRRMIVADDDEDICRDIVKKMDGTGVDVQYTTKGSQVIDIIRSAREAGDPFDLILLDWRMPDMDGPTVAQLIREKYPEKIPLLLFMAGDWREIEQAALDFGIVHFLQKPFFMSNLEDVLRRMAGTEQKKLPDDDKEFMAGRRVLVVEDIEINQLVVKKLLSTLKAECDVAENGQKAVEIFENAPADKYDLILMDIQMPIMNGYEATQAIRASTHPAAQTIPIVAMSANAFVEDVRHALEAGMNAHISKPVVFEDFKNMLREVLSKKRGIM